VHIEHVALADYAGEIELVPEEPWWTGNAVQAQAHSAQNVAVPVTRLDDAADELGLRRCDVVKVDTEGGELAFLRGGGSFLRRHRPVIMLELNSQHMRRHDWNDHDLMTLANEWGYRIELLDGQAFSPPKSRDSITDVFLVPLSRERREPL
jgi:hypothetical protein